MSDANGRQPIDRAIDTAETKAKAAADPDRLIRQVVIPLHVQPLALGVQHTLTLDPPKNGEPMVMIREGDGSWYVVLLPTGTRWALVPEKPPPKSRLHLPPGYRA